MTEYAIFFPVDESKKDAVLAFLKDASTPSNIQKQKTTELQLTAPNDVTKLTKTQQEIVQAITYRPLNITQIGVLEAHLRSFKAGGGHLSINKVAEYLVERYDEETMMSAVKKVEGALRSFGKRLKAFMPVLTEMPHRMGKDKFGDGVADPVPLLAMFSIIKDGNGVTRHRLNDDAAIAVALALGSSASGSACSVVWQEGDDPNEVVGVGMSLMSAAVLYKVAENQGLSLDEAILHLGSLAGVGN